MSRNQFAPVPLLRTLALSTAPAQKSTPPPIGNSVNRKTLLVDKIRWTC